MIRFAEQKDTEDLLRMCLAFKEASPYADLETDTDRIKQLIAALVDGDRSQKLLVVAVEDDKPVGMLAAVTTEMLFSNKKIAGELVWWVDPEYRQKQHGIELLAALMVWAGKIGCSVLTVALLEDENLDTVKELLIQNGFRPGERSYMKVL